jgi:hypothetical protein
MELVEETFTKFRDVLISDGGYLINATRGGKLEVLIRQEFDDVVSQHLRDD